MKRYRKLTNRSFPVIYGIFSALIGFIAGFFIAQRSFRQDLPAAVGIGALVAIVCFVIAYFRGHASAEIKRIVAKYHLQDVDLAKITGLKASDFPIYHNRLSLIIPQRQWPRVLDALQKYEQNHPLDKEEKQK